ncbi:MAG: biotin--[acetyl-CoA-carboxylase] ligase [Phycisphaerales bacterium]
MSHTIERFETIDSTQMHARRVIASGRGPGAATAYVAAEQSGGVGRLGRAYACPRGGLWLTLAVPFVGARPPADVLDGLGLRLGVACLGVLDAALAGADVPAATLKWPNDVLVDCGGRGKKVLGVLAEVVAGPASAGAATGDVGRGPGTSYILVGVGINANFAAAVLPEDLRERATTLADLVGHAVDLAALESDLIARLLEAMSTSGLPAATLAVAQARLHGIGEEADITVPAGERVHGTLLGIDSRGFVRVRTQGGEEVVGMMPVEG